MNDLEQNIALRAEEVFVKIRPFLQEDGGDIEFVKFETDTKTMEVRLLGNCRTCPLSLMTLRAGIERFIIHDIPEVRRVENVR